MSLAQQLARIGELFGGNQNASGLPLSNRNYIVDGNFEQWINASVVLGVAGFGNTSSPMYYNYAGVGGNATISKSVPSVGTEPVGMTAPFTSAMLHNQTVSSTGTFGTTGPYIQQLVESVRTLQGRSATVSMWLWCAAGTLSIPSINVSQSFGTGGSPSSLVSVSVTTNWTVTTTPQRFSVRVDIPSILGKTLGSNVNDSLQVQVPLPVGATYSITTAQWQLEQSSANAPAAGMPTTFEYRGQQAELARVQRYYEASTQQVLWSGNTTSGSNYYSAVTFKVVKRASPTVTIAQSGGVANFPSTAPSNSGQTVDGAGAVVAANATGNGGVYGGTFTADARL